MHRITLILILSLLIPSLYIYFVYLAKRTRNLWWRLLYWLPSLVIIGWYCALMYLTDNAMAHHMKSISRLAIVTLLIASSQIMFMLCSMIGVVIHALIPRCPRRYFTWAGIVLGTLCFFSMGYGVTFGPRHFVVKQVEYASAKLPPGFDGYRIVQLSDLHIGSWQGNEADIRRLVDLVNAQQADVIVFTGDLVNQRSLELEGFQSILSRLHAPHGVYSILGNHDYGDYYHWNSPREQEANMQQLLKRQHDMGWQMLNNDHTILYNRGDSIALIGVENDGEPPFSQHADLPRAIEGTEGLFSILLSHNPTHWRREVLPRTDIDLMLAGHTHAMQMKVFGLSPAALRYPEWSGLYRQEERALYVNEGIGFVGLPFRFGAWPEVTVITLKCKSQSDSH